MNFRFIILIAILFSFSSRLHSQIVESTGEINDSLIFIKKIEQFRDAGCRNSEKLVIKIAKSFIGTPYKGKTLDGNNSESLVLNLHELDCTTFVESCLALALTTETIKPTYVVYRENLKKLRYRNGILGGYSSRLHYFSDWITDNQKKGIIKNITKEIGGILYHKEINFMSKHPGYYAQLVNNQALVDSIIQFEKEISAGSYYYVPKEKVESIESKLKEGMIVAITSGLEGLDIAHLGFLVKQKGRIYLLHASSDAGKVVVSTKPLTDYLAGNKKQTGIMVLRIE